jgi:hypothetical protein
MASPSSSSAAKPQPPKKKETWAEQACACVGIGAVICVCLVVLYAQIHFGPQESRCYDLLISPGQVITRELHLHLSKCRDRTFMCHCRFLNSLSYCPVPFQEPPINRTQELTWSEFKDSFASVL